MEPLDLVYVPKAGAVTCQHVVGGSGYHAKHVHMHDTYEINLISTPSLCQFQCNGERLEVEAPALVLYKRGSYHEILSAGQPFESHLIYFDPAVFDACGVPFDETEPLFHADLTCFSLSETERDSFLSLFSSVEREEGKARIFLLLSVLAKMEAFLQSGREAVRSKNKENYLFGVLRYLQDHPEEKITIDELASRFHVSPSKLKTDFHRITGFSVKRFLIRQRLCRACVLLQGERTLAQIASLCGFSGESRLICAFREEFGVTPGEYRRRLEEKK